MNDNHPLLQQRPTLNPYLTAIRLVVSRLKWDLAPQALRSRRLLRASMNVHQGRKAVILCNGPSLMKADFELLRHSGVYTFGLNKINLLFDKTEFRPNAIVAVNPFVIQQNCAFYNETGIPLFLDSAATTNVRARENVVYLHSTSILRFARDCRISINQGGTVTFVALQLAYHFGFDEVAIVGCDHDFIQKGPANLVVSAGSSDPSHFDPNYFSQGVPWQLPDLVQSEMSYMLARETFAASGRRIVNCTEGGKLEVFPRQDLSDFLESAR